MTVRQTESRLPNGLTPFDLGQAVQSEDGRYALVSFLSSPIVKNTVNYYVVFALNGAPVDSYHWTFESIPSGHSETGYSDPDKGYYKYAPPKIGTLYVVVQILAAGSPPVTLKMVQEIMSSDPRLEVLIGSSSGAFGGNPKISRELINNFKQYTLDVIHGNAINIPEGFLASIVYSGLIDQNNLSRFEGLEKAAKYINQSGADSIRTAYHAKQGVCQLTPCQAAMIFKKPFSSADEPCLPMVDYPSERSLEEVCQELESSFDRMASDPNVGDFRNLKTDLFNLLRFPKTNIKLCAEYITKLKNRENRWRNLGPDEFLNDVQAIQVVASEFKTFPNTAPAPTNPPTANEAIAIKEGVAISNLLQHPVIYNHFRHIFRVEGRVVDNSTDGKGARIDLYRTVIRIIHDLGLSCFTLPDSGSPELIFGGKEVVIEEGQTRSVLEFKPNYPTNETDWAMIDTGFGLGWIKVRSGNVRYASHVYDERQRENIATTNTGGYFALGVKGEQYYRLRAIKEHHFDAWSERFRVPTGDVSIQLISANNALPEHKIIRLLSRFDGFTYGSAHYPYKLVGAEIAADLIIDVNSASKTNNCSSFTEALLVKAWQDNVSGFTYDPDSHIKWMANPKFLNKDTRMQVLDPIIEKGMGEFLTQNEPGQGTFPDIEPMEWTIIQGYVYEPSNDQVDPPEDERKKWTVGHIFIIVDIHPETKRVLTLESNNVYGLNGPGFRKLAHLDANNKWVSDHSPVKHWWLRDGLHTWEEIKQQYPYRKLVRLFVNDLKWVK